jgi:hypothetical protein
VHWCFICSKERNEIKELANNNKKHTFMTQQNSMPLAEPKPACLPKHALNFHKCEFTIGEKTHCRPLCTKKSKWPQDVATVIGKLIAANGKLRRITLYASLEICDRVASMRRWGSRSAKVSDRGVTIDGPIEE